MTTVVYQAEYGKEYRPPTQAEIDAAEIPEEALNAIADRIPLGIPDEPMPGAKMLGFVVPLYGFKKWSDVFTNRQLLALMTFVKWTKKANSNSQWMICCQNKLDALCPCLRWYIDAGCSSETDFQLTLT